MVKIAERWGIYSPREEMEDVFFSRHIARITSPPPLEIAQAFSTETTYNPHSIGSHACWKYLTNAEMSDHLNRHLKSTWAMVQAKEKENEASHKTKG